MLGEQAARRGCNGALGRGAVFLAGRLVTGAVQRLEGRHQMVLAIADQVGAAHGLQGLA